jgi:DNA-binding NtrC family response regulator
VVDDEPNVLATLKMALSVEGYEVDVAGDLTLARRRAQKESYAAALIDVGLPDGSGVELLRELRDSNADIACIMMSGQATIPVAIEATRLGAKDFLEKPVSTDRLLISLRNGLRLSALEQETIALRSERGDTDELRGSSAAMSRLRELLARAAPATASVLLTGERGTGKELAARALHRSSARASNQLEKLNCAAVPENLIESELFGHEAGAFTGATKRRIGKFERAHRGSLFLDEVGDMPLAMQAKLLRVLQEQELERVGGSEVVQVDVRVIAATNRDLPAEVRAGRFRADLLDRLNVLPIHLPPLRERREDIPELVEGFLAWARARNDRPRVHITPAALETLVSAPYEGNVRELRNLIERLVILTPEEVIDRDFVRRCLGPSLPPSGGFYRSEATFRQLTEEAETAILREALAAHGGQMARAARALGMERSHLYKKTRALGLRSSDGDGEGSRTTESTPHEGTPGKERVPENDGKG